MLEQIFRNLTKLQNPDGGWGSGAGRGSQTEATSWALLGLISVEEPSARDSAKRAAEWLARRQNQDGSLPLSDAAREGSWTTALAVLALNAHSEHRPAALRAVRWVLQQEGSKPGILAELILWATGRRKVNELDRDLIGWSWVPNSFSWVEPTSYALLALKKLRGELADTNVNDRIRDGEAMIYDRMCTGGGWNYGNSKVLDYALWPYPDITALALIALQDRAAEPANQTSLTRLRMMAKETGSGLALAWGMICLNLYGQDSTEWNRLIENRFTTTGFLGETKTLALALLALSGNVTTLRL